MVEFAVEIQEILIGQLRDNLRGAAGLMRIAGIRVKRVLRVAVKHALRGGKCTFHLIVNDTVYRDRAVRRLHLVMPALLAENLLFFIDIRMQNRVHIDVHQVLEIFVVAACNRVYRLIRVGHRV